MLKKWLVLPRAKCVSKKKKIVAIFPFDVFIPTIENCTS